MLSRDNLNEPAICFSDLQACEEFIRQMQYNIMLRQQTFFQFIIFTLVNDHFIVWPSIVTLTFNFSND